MTSIVLVYHFKMAVKEKPEMEEPVKLKKVLSFWDLSAYFICAVIGSGIFVSPKGILEHTGSTGAALVVWLVTGIFNAGVCLCYAELTLTFPQAGGDYVYLK